jgi:hypothetical protein
MKMPILVSSYQVIIITVGWFFRFSRNIDTEHKNGRLRSAATVQYACG